MRLDRPYVVLGLLLGLLLTGCPGGTHLGSDITTGIKGRIVDANGRGVPSASVTLNRADGEAGSGSIHGTTDQGGAYAFRDLPKGTYNVTVTTLDGYGAFKAGLLVSDAASVTVDLTVARLGAIRGAALLEGRPSDSAGIALSLAGTDFGAETSADGSFVIDGVPAGTFDLFAEARAHVRALVPEVEVAPGSTTDLPTPIVLAALNAPPIPAFVISISDGVASVDATAATDPDGSIASYAWDFGDGATGTGAVAQHIYGAEGTYQVTLTVTDDLGLSANLTKDAEVTFVLHEVTVNQDPGEAVSTMRIDPGGVARFRVAVAAGTAAVGSALYVELDHDMPLDVTWQGVTYHSSSPDSFGAELAPAAATSLRPAAVGVLLTCRGSCVIVDAVAASAIVAVWNPGEKSVVFDLFAYVEDYRDVGEPSNDTIGGAAVLSLGGLDSGAIEAVGDIDYFLVGSTSTLSFDAVSGIALQAMIVDDSGNALTETLAPGASLEVIEGEYVRVSALGDVAASEAYSTYYLSIQ